MDEHSRIALSQYTVRSDVLGNSRSIWVQEPTTSRPGAAALAIFLDGEYFLGHLGAPTAMAALQQRGTLPPTWSIYVAGRERKVRWPENFCNPALTSFVCDELLPQLEEKTGTTTECLLAGLSLTGLSAAHIALSRPGVFSRVLCLSGSFWWDDGWLARQVPGFARANTMFRMTVGTKESDAPVDHGHGLIQELSQIEGVRCMRDALEAHGFLVDYAEFDGGHDVPSWRRDLPNDLRILWQVGRLG